MEMNTETNGHFWLHILPEMLIRSYGHQHHTQNSTRKHNERNTETKRIVRFYYRRC